MRNKSSSCFFCGGPVKKSTRSAKANQPVEFQDNDEIINAWEDSCVLSTCRILGIPSSHQAVGTLLETKMYCDVCVQLMRDMDFTVRAMDKLQRNIRRFRRILLEKLEWKAVTKAEGPSNSNSNTHDQFDLFSFVFEKAQDVSKEDGTFPLPVLVERRKPTNKPVLKVTSDQAPLITAIKEEITVEDRENCEEGEDFSLSAFEPDLIPSDFEDNKGRQTKPDFSIRTRSKKESSKSEDESSVKSGGDNFDADFSCSSDDQIELRSNIKRKQESEDDNCSDKDFSISGEDEPGDFMSSSDSESNEAWYMVSEVEKKTQKSTGTRKSLQDPKKGIPKKKRRKEKIPCTISCPYTDCKVMFKSDTALDTHIKKQHKDSDEKLFPCDLCDKTFLLTHNLRIHLAMIHKGKYVQKAQEKGIKPRTRKPQKKTPPNGTEYEDKNLPLCSFCGVPQKVEELESHENQHRSREFPFSCLICEDAKFEGAPILTRHMNEFHPPSNYEQCHHCGIWLKPGRLESHLIRKCEFDPEKHFKCSYCSVIFKNGENLEKHQLNCVKAPHNKFKFVCEQCGKVCATKKTLLSHKVKHDDARPYVCKVCGKGFKWSFNLKYHEKIHAGLKFPCPDCPMVFTTGRYLKHHSKRHLPRVLKRYRRDKSKKVLKICPDGDKCMKRHPLIHTGFPFKCDKCPKTFRNSEYLRQHADSHLPKELRTFRKPKMKTSDKTCFEGGGGGDDYEEVDYSSSSCEDSGDEMELELLKGNISSHN